MTKVLQKILMGPVVRDPTVLGAPRVHKLDQRLEPDVLARLIADYESGVSSTELQRTYRLSKGSVLKLLGESGVAKRRKPLAEDEVAGMSELYTQGCTIREIAAEVGHAKTTVQDALERSGVEMRPAARRVRNTLG